MILEDQILATVSLDLIKSIRFYCFEQTGKFYKRYIGKSLMSLVTFRKILSSNPVRKEYIEALNDSCEGLGLIDANHRPSSESIRYSVSKKMLSLIEILHSDTSIQNLKKLYDYSQRYKELIVS